LDLESGRDDPGHGGGADDAEGGVDRDGRALGTDGSRGIIRGLGVGTGGECEQRKRSGRTSAEERQGATSVKTMIERQRPANDAETCSSKAAGEEAGGLYMCHGEAGVSSVRLAASPARRAIQPGLKTSDQIVE
jgi:hypothetical protein